jgi:hypothetical protein
VNKVHIIVKAVERFDSMVVLEIAVDGSLRMVGLAGDCCWILLFKDHFSDDDGLVRYG